MNEKFLSRGKREDTGKWVEGYYVELPEEQHGGQLHLIIGLDGQYNRIIPETAGRCAGLTDKNSTKIFEGDIIDYKGDISVMKFIDGFATFDLRPICNMSFAPRLTPNTVAFMSVIGNIYDNPELLKGDDRQ